SSRQPTTGNRLELEMNPVGNGLQAVPEGTPSKGVPYRIDFVEQEDYRADVDFDCEPGVASAFQVSAAPRFRRPSRGGPFDRSPTATMTIFSGTRYFCATLRT